MTRSAARASAPPRRRRSSVAIDLDGPEGKVHAATGLPFFDHMLDQLGRHGGFDLTVEAKGDLHVDGHHTVEDVGIVLGEAFREALGDKAGVRRFASGLFPLDEALVEVALDLSGPPVRGLRRAVRRGAAARRPAVQPRDGRALLAVFATAAGITLHVAQRAGSNTHHVVEATFKGVARCLRDAVRVEGGAVPSTKGSL